MTVTVDVAYPLELAYGWDSAADLFAAAFGGDNSAQHLRRAGVEHVVLVDNNEKLLGRIPLEDGWSAFVEDAWEWADKQPDRSFDAVILDPFTNLMDDVIVTLPRFLRLARRHAVVGVCTATNVAEFGGWRKIDVIRRSHNFGGVWWLVMERE